MTPRRRLYVVEERDEKTLEWAKVWSTAAMRSEGRRMLRRLRALREYAPSRASFMTRLAVYVCSGRAR